MKVYWDSCLAIYEVERALGFSDRLRAARERVPESEICISDLVRLECLVLPMRRRDEVLIRAYQTRMAAWVNLPIEPDVFDLAAELRANHRLKTPDALHLACAIRHGCDELWTNDGRFGAVSSQIAIRVLT